MMFFADTISMDITNNALIPIMIIIFQWGPLLLILFAFKMAGGIMSKGAELLSNYNKRGTEFVKGNPNDPNSFRNTTKRRLNEQMARGHARAVKAGDATDANAFRRVRGRIAGSRIFGNTDQRLSTYNEMAAKRRDALSNTGDDSLLYAAAGYQKNGKYYNSKGQEISGNLYRRGKANYGKTKSEVAANLEYTLRKAQSDEDIMNFREAFRQNAISNNWNGDEAFDVWATATYPHKDKWKSEWYSKPSVTTDRRGRTTGVNYADVRSNADNYDKMIGEFHKVPENYRLSSIRAQDWHAMGGMLDHLQTRIDSGTATEAELRRFAQTDEVLNTMARDGMVTRNAEGEVMVQGANAETQAVISAIYKNRKYATAHAVESGSRVSTTDRAIYDVRAVETALRASPGMPRDDAIRMNTRQVAKNVSNDRSTIR